MSHQTPQAGPAKPVRSTASSAILIATSVVGGFALLGAVGSAAFGLRAPETWDVAEQIAYSDEYVEDLGDVSLYADAVGVTSIEIDAAYTSLTLKFDDVEEAVLAIEGADPSDSAHTLAWTLERDGATLTVERHREGALARGQGRVEGDNCLFGCGPRLSGEQSATLTLPLALGENRAADLDVQISAGEFVGSGSFNEASFDVSMGDLEFEGDARTLELDVRLGDSTVEVADVEEADISVATGDSTVVLSGAAPTRVDLEATMGAMSVRLPKETYQLDASDAVGVVESKLSTSKDSKHVVTVEARAAEVLLK